MAPRVTLGFSTYNRTAFLREALESCLNQDYDDFEVLVIDNGSEPETGAILDEYRAHPRLRTIRYEQNIGIARVYDAIWREARGELVARIGDDDVCLPDRLSRQVAVFDRHPETGIVHGDALTIDEHGREIGQWRSAEYPRRELIDLLIRRANNIVDPSTMIRRQVFETIGGYDPAWPGTNDYDIWLRAAPHFRFRHTPGGPVIRYRRHSGSYWTEADQARELREVEGLLALRLEDWPLEDLVPELDWSVLPQAWAERRAREVLADAFEARSLPELAASFRERAAATADSPFAPARTPNGKRIVLTSYGFEDSGGGTIVPRYLAKELAQRGWDVTVFHAAVRRLEGAGSYAVREWEQDGVKLVGVFNRPHVLLDLGHPLREVDDPPIAEAFAQTLDRVQPDVVHFHNLHNLGVSLVDETAVRGIPTLFSTHNYWLVDPRNYLFEADLELSHGPADGGRATAASVGSNDAEGYAVRRTELRERFGLKVDRCLAVSRAVARTLEASGFDPAQMTVLRQAMPEDTDTWEKLGRDRAPGRQGETLVVGFVGSAYPHKGPQLLVEAAQSVDCPIEVRIHGEIQPDFARRLLSLDTRGVVRLCGAYAHAELPGILAGLDAAVIPSLWWDCAPLVVAECLAGRVPVVASRMGGMTDFVEHEVNGLLFDGRSAPALAEALTRLGTEDGLVERLQAQIQAPKPFAQYVDELETLYAGGEPPAQPAPDGVVVRWVGDQHKASSLSTVNAEVTSRLIETEGFSVERDANDGAIDQPALPRPPDVEVRHQWPPDFTDPGIGRLALIQPWEYGAIPTAWVEPLQRHVEELWVPSEFVRQMYLDAGIEADRVHVVPNGVDLEVFRPEGPESELDGAGGGLRLLFVGGTIARKGPDVLLEAYRRAFAGRHDVTLVVKDVGAATFYKHVSAAGSLFGEHGDALPRVVYLTEDLDREGLAALYRSCDALVHPYRGEGFAMPVLEAMACGLPVVVTGGGPTDEFCPESASWRIASSRVVHDEAKVAHLETVERPWTLEPDVDDLVRILGELDADQVEVARRGAAARTAAEAYSWDAVAAQYAERCRALAARPLRPIADLSDPFPLPDPAPRNLLATPAWLGTDRLAALLKAWSEAFSEGDPVCLYLLADRVRGGAERCEEHVLAAVEEAGIGLDGLADIVVLEHDLHGDDPARLHHAVDGFVSLHDACTGHARWAARFGNPVVEPTAEALRAWASLRIAA
jgi:glycosyltransferase involved in cell wall biosynthesis